MKIEALTFFFENIVVLAFGLMTVGLFLTAMIFALRIRRRQTKSFEKLPLDPVLGQVELGNKLFRLGDRDSRADLLQEAIAAYSTARQQMRSRRSRDWALTQNNLGAALAALGRREAGTASLEEAIAAFRAALEERTRERVPLDWAQTQTRLGSALAALAKRQKDAAHLEEALTCMRGAVEVYLQSNETYWLPLAQRCVTEMEADLIQLKQ
jgi:tetratricopeptide (TPR) repeat protein